MPWWWRCARVLGARRRRFSACCACRMRWDVYGGHGVGGCMSSRSPHRTCPHGIGEWAIEPTRGPRHALLPASSRTQPPQRLSQGMGHHQAVPHTGLPSVPGPRPKRAGATYVGCRLPSGTLIGCGKIEDGKLPKAHKPTPHTHPRHRHQPCRRPSPKSRRQSSCPAVNRSSNRPRPPPRPGSRKCHWPAAT